MYPPFEILLGSVTVIVTLPIPIGESRTCVDNLCTQLAGTSRYALRARMLGRD
jgi:hypothetical protein